MAHVPRLMCGLLCQGAGVEDPKGLEMKCERIGVRVRVDLKKGEPYYIVSADRWTCRCGNSVLLTGPGQHPIKYAHDDDFDRDDCHEIVLLRP